MTEAIFVGIVVTVYLVVEFWRFLMGVGK